MGIGWGGKATVYDEKEADVKASLKMAKLFDEIKKTNAIAPLEVIKSAIVMLENEEIVHYKYDESNQCIMSQ